MCCVCVYSVSCSLWTLLYLPCLAPHSSVSLSPLFLSLSPSPEHSSLMASLNTPPTHPHTPHLSPSPLTPDSSHNPTPPHTTTSLSRPNHKLDHTPLPSEHPDLEIYCRRLVSSTRALITNKHSANTHSGSGISRAAKLREHYSLSYHHATSKELLRGENHNHFPYATPCGHREVAEVHRNMSSDGWDLRSSSSQWDLSVGCSSRVESVGAVQKMWSARETQVRGFGEGREERGREEGEGGREGGRRGREGGRVNLRTKYLNLPQIHEEGVKSHLAAAHAPLVQGHRVSVHAPPTQRKKRQLEKKGSESDSFREWAMLGNKWCVSLISFLFCPFLLLLPINSSLLSFPLSPFPLSPSLPSSLPQYILHPSSLPQYILQPFLPLPSSLPSFPSPSLPSSPSLLPPSLLSPAYLDPLTGGCSKFHHRLLHLSSFVSDTLRLEKRKRAKHSSTSCHSAQGTV